MPQLVKVDTTRLRLRLGQLLKVVGGDSRAVVRTEMAHLIEDLANATTKPSRQHRRISRDFGAAFRPARGAAQQPRMDELYKVLDAFGRGGRRVPVRAKAFFVTRHQHRRRIGFLAAGWLGGGNPTRAHRIPGAVKQQPVLGTFSIIDRPTHYTLTATNRVPFARHMRGLVIIIQKALNKRAGSIKRNITFLLAGKPYQYR